MSRLRAAGLFLLLGVLWGLSFPAIEVGLETLPPILFAAVRYDAAAALLLGYAVAATRRWRPHTRGDAVAVAAGGVLMVAGNSLLFLGQQFTTGSVAAIIYSLIPILTTMFAFVLLPEERFTLVGLAGVLLGLVGVALVARPDPENLLADDVVGKALVLAAAVSVSLGSVVIRRVDIRLNRTSFTGWSMLLGAALLHAWSLLAGESAAVTLSTRALVAVGYLAVLATAVAFLIYFTLLDAHGPLKANLVSYFVPVVATVGGVLLVDESVTPLTLVGFAVIFAGFALLNRRSLADALGGRAWLAS